MNGLRAMIASGGPAIIAIMLLSVLLYARCCQLLTGLWQSRRQLARDAAPTVTGLAIAKRRQRELADSYRQQRLAIGAMITAAPLLGLLGTVMGMIGAFDSLAVQGGGRSMEGLAAGISEVLVDTESGLAVAIPALLLLYLAHRQMEKIIHDIALIEERSRLAR
jgi:biopolymer transport protein ExbB/TolQ